MLGRCRVVTSFLDDLFITCDGDCKWAFPRVSGQICRTNFDLSRPDLELRGGRQCRNADHTWTVSGIVWKEINYTNQYNTNNAVFF